MGWPVVILVLFGVIPASSFTAPENVVHQKGETDTVITCEVPSHGTVTGKRWYKTSESDTEIAGNDGIVTGMENDYALVSDGNNWNLKIKKPLTIDDADKYICKTAANTGTARLILVDTPSCNLADKDTDKVTFTCNTTYGGDWPPTATMKDNSDADIGSGVAGAGGTLRREQEIPIAAANNGHNYKCEMGLVIADNPDDGTSNVAQNVPVTSDGKYECSSTAATPGTVTITPAGAEFSEGDTLTCSAAGNPSPKIQWSDTGGDLPSSNGVLTLTTDMAGQTLTCTASNNIGTDTASRAVTTVEETTAAPTTIPPTVPLGNGDSTVTQADTYTRPENSATCHRSHLLIIAFTFLSALFISRS